jgi:hypothetical protein
MINSPAEMAKKPTTSHTPSSMTAQGVTPASEETSGAGATLDGRYRQIGISAVAAAVRYQGVAKNQAYAPAQTNWRYFAEVAAA